MSPREPAARLSAEAARPPGNVGDPHEGQQIPLHIDGFTIEGVLGQGTSSIVYLARQTRPARRVALKVLIGAQLGRTWRERFEREVELMGSIEHPNITRLYGTGLFSEAGFEYPYLVIERVDGLMLTEHADSQGLGLRARLQLLATVARAVHFMHSRGVVHRDLKPQNILVDRTGIPKLLDFGIARPQDDQENSLLTRQGDLLGTLPYMAPEQIAGDLPRIDPLVDVYALGVIGHELTTGQLPYHAEAFRTVITAAQTLRQHPPEQVLNRSNLPRDLRMVLAKAVHSDRPQRYGSALEFALDLERFLHHEPVHAQPPALLHGLRLFVRRRAAVASALGVSLLSMVLALGVSIHFALGEASARRLETQARAKAESRAQILQATNEFVDQILVGADPVNAKGAALTMREVVTSAARELQAHPPAEPAVAIHAGLEIGDALVNMHDMETGMPLLERAADLARKTPDLDPALRLSALYDEAASRIPFDFSDTPVRHLRAVLTETPQDPAGEPRDIVKLWTDVRLALAQALLQNGYTQEAMPLLDALDNAVRKGHLPARADQQYVAQTRITAEYLQGHFQALIDRQAHDDANVARTNGEASVLRQTLFHAAALSAIDLGDLPLAHRLMVRWVDLAISQFGAKQQNTLEAQSKLAYIEHLQQPHDPKRVARLGELMDALRHTARVEPTLLETARINYAAALLSQSPAQRARGVTDLRGVLEDVANQRLPDSMNSARAGLILAQYLKAHGARQEADAVYTPLCTRLAQKMAADHPYLLRCTAGLQGQTLSDPQR